MPPPSNEIIIIFLLITTFLIVLMGAFIFSLLFIHNRNQISHFEKIKEVEANNEKNLLITKLEIQEETFQHISREIHDNISLSLTLAKLNLNVIEIIPFEKWHHKISNSIELISNSISDLNNISKSLNPDQVIRHGLIAAIENEIDRIRQIGIIKIGYFLKGNAVYLESRRELVVFRIVQEALNNIIRHSCASCIELGIQFCEFDLTITLTDNGQGFNTKAAINNDRAGIKNMTARAHLLGGSINIMSMLNQGTTITIKIPLKSNEKTS